MLKYIKSISRLLYSLLMVLLMSFMSSKAFAQQVEEVDSAYLMQIEQLIAESEMRQVLDQYNDNLMKEEMRFEYSDLIPIVKGAISMFTRHDFIYNHPAYFKSTHSGAKDYAVAGAPLVAAWVMKAAGVKSRSTTRRMLTANAIALALAGGLTEGTKHMVNEVRPDKTDNNSFPSGHAALSYVGATVLSREFGHVSPWITVGAYGTATATQLLRIKHNAHWLNDVYMGAGIGVVSTNFGYWLADRIYGEEGINRPEMTRRDLERTMKMMGRPSSFALVSIADLGSNTIAGCDLDMRNLVYTTDKIFGFEAHLTSFNVVGVEGSWFITPNLALEAVAQSGLAQAKLYSNYNTEYMGNTLQMYRGSMAIKGSVPVPGTSMRFAVRALGGVRHFDRCPFYDTESEYYHPEYSLSIAIPSETKFEMGLGFSYDILATKSHVMGFNADYYHAFSHLTPNRFQIGTVWRVLF